MSGKPTPSKRRKAEENIDVVLPNEECETKSHHYQILKQDIHDESDQKATLDEFQLDSEVHQEELEDGHEHIIEDGIIDPEDHQLSETLGYAVNSWCFRKVNKGRKRLPLEGNSDGSRQRYYDRYKNQDYVKRNDVYKYCQVCRKKVHGKLRSLPSEHRLRRCWILRLNLDMERSAELWLRDAFSDATHCGEVCALHFPVGTENYKNRELLPIDIRQDAHNYSRIEDENFDFDALELECVYCDSKNPLRYMIPFIRTRSRRYKWINALAGDTVDSQNTASMLQERLKSGASKFLCDWHFSDSDFDINQYGEWRIRRDSMPNPMLMESDKKAQRIYMINHGDTILSRPLDYRREEALLAKEYRTFALKCRQNAYSNYYSYDDNDYHYEDGNLQEQLEAALAEDEQSSSSHFLEDPVIDEQGVEIAGPSSNISSSILDYSDDSDVEIGDAEHYRYCAVCDRAVSSERALAAYRPRVWPLDEPRHLKWLEILNWGTQFDNHMKQLYQKRRASILHPERNEYQPLDVCQNHLDMLNLYEKYDDWLQSYCVLCDTDLGDPNLLLPFPRDRSERLLWMHKLLKIPNINKVQEKRWKWLKERLTRPKPTRYKLCVYHFNSDAFHEKDECVEFDDAALPLPLGLSDFELIPRGIWGVIKCPLCDEWRDQSQLMDIRPPSTQAERVLFVELLEGDKAKLKRGVEQLSIHPCRICKSHIPEEINDPYSIIAERKLLSKVEVTCLQCNRRDTGSTMVPLPFDLEKRQNWIDLLSRDHVRKPRLLQRVDMEGRHYLCTAHFHKSSIRYIPGLGVWKRLKFLPVVLAERNKFFTEPDVEYNPLIIAGIDDRGEGIMEEMNYDDVLNMLGEAPAEPTFSEERGILKSQATDSKDDEKNELRISKEGESFQDEQSSDGPPILEPEITPEEFERRNNPDLHDEIDEEIERDHIVVVDDHMPIEEAELLLEDESSIPGDVYDGVEIIVEHEEEYY